MYVCNPCIMTYTKFSAIKNLNLYVLPYQCLPCYKYQNDEVERNLSCKCTVLCYILEYMYILQISKRRIGPVLAFNVQIPDQVECLAVFAC